MYPTFYVDMIPIGLAVYALFKAANAKVVDLTLRLSQLCAILLIIAQIGWMKSYAKDLAFFNVMSDFVWVLFNSLVMIIAILIANRKNDFTDHVSARLQLVLNIAKEKNESVAMLGIVAIVLGLGFIFGTGNNTNYEHLYSNYSHHFWGAIFLTYGVFRLSGLVFNVPAEFKVLNGVIGLWCWIYVALSFTVFDQTPTAPTEYLLFIPVLIESWVLLSTVSTKWRSDK